MDFNVSSNENVGISNETVLFAQGIRVLAVDDNEVNNVLFKGHLADTPICVDTVKNAADAVMMLKNNEYDMVFLDHMMPDMDGISLLKLIREENLCPNVPVIALTANDISGARENYLQAGFSDYVSKPVDRETLINTIKNNISFEMILPSKESESTEENQELLPLILVVDDDRMSLKVTQRILEDKYRVTCVSSGMAALEFLGATIPDLILLDLRMPEMDGFEVMEYINTKEKLREIPIICFTADNDRKSEAKSFQLGALDFIGKPVIAEIMCQRVTRILELYRLRNNLQNEVEKKTRESERRQVRLKRLTTQALQTLAGTIDAKDKYTNGHSVRVAEYSVEIAKRLNMSEKEQEDIYYMGLLHDIGKIGIPDEIINKTSRLTDEEFGTIKTHPSIGSEILKKMSELPEIATGARWHHERYDGRGYPDGLAGENIPAVARIIGVADAYDAMTSNRSYRAVLAQEIVRSEIEKGKGTQFDPVIAEIMLKIIDEDTEYKLREIKEENKS